MTAADDAAELRAATREAHEAMKDLRLLLRKAGAAHHMIETAAQEAVDTGISKAVEQGLEQYAGALAKAIEDATAATFKRFDAIADMMLGETRQHRRAGDPSLADYAQRIMARRDEQCGHCHDNPPQGHTCPSCGRVTP